MGPKPRAMPADGAALVRLVENEKTAFYEGFACVPGRRVVREDGLVRLHTGLAAASYNAVLHTEAPDDGLDELIARVAKEFDGLPMRWLVAATDRPMSLRQRLLATGFACTEEQVGMAARLDELLEPPAPAGVALERISPESGLAEWAATMARGFGMPEGAAAVLEAAHSPRLRMRDTHAYWLARLEGRAVATVLAHTAGGVAGLYAIAVDPVARGRGIGSYATVAPLAEAREAGHEVATLQASAPGYGAYRRLGFRSVCPIASYTPIKRA